MCIIPNATLNCVFTLSASSSTKYDVTIQNNITWHHIIKESFNLLSYGRRGEMKENQSSNLTSERQVGRYVLCDFQVNL